MINKLRTALQMDADTLGSVVRAWLILARVRLLTALPYRLWRNVLREAVSAHGAGAGAPDPYLLRAFGVALRNQPGRPSCLRRALALNALLRGHGCPARLVIGVARHGGGIEAHAWVEVHGAVVGDATDVARRFAPITVSAGNPLAPQLARSILGAP